MSIRKRFISALGANITTQAVTVCIQILSVPIFLHVWSLEQYGAWLILSALPVYFMLSDMGFLAATINKMSIAAAMGDSLKVRAVFQSTLKLYLFVLAGVAVLAGAAAAFLDSAPFDSWENKLALVLLAIGAVLTMSSALLDAVFRANGEYALGTQICSLARLLEWAGLAAGALLGKTFLSAAIGHMCACGITAVIKWQIASRRHPDIAWSVGEASGEEIRELLRPALAFSALPLGNAISIQGMTLMVGHLFGPVFVVVFNTYRTIARIQTQVVTTVSRSIWPEVSRQFGAGDMAALRRLYWHGTMASIALGVTAGFALLLLGPSILQIWTSGRVPYMPILFNLFLVSCVVTSIWQMGQVLMSAINQHAVIAIAYLLASIVMLVATWAMAPVGGQYAAVVSLIGFEIMLMAICYSQVSKFFQNRSADI